MPRRSNLSSFIVKLLSNPIEAVADTAPKVLIKKYPEAAVAMAVVGALSLRGRKTLLGGISDGEGHPSEAIKEMKRRKIGMVPIVIGTQGSGKTNMSLMLAREVNNPHSYVLGMHDAQIPKDFIRLSSINQIFSLPANSTVILDDLGQVASLYMTNNKSRQQVLDLVAQCRHLKLMMIINAQNSSMIQRRWLDTIEFCFIKQPIISEELERQALKKVYKRAIAAYSGHVRDRQWIWSHVYVFSLYGEGMMEYDLKEVY